MNVRQSIVELEFFRLVIKLYNFELKLLFVPFIFKKVNFRILFSKIKNKLRYNYII